MIKGRSCKVIYAAIGRTITPPGEASRILKSGHEPIIMDYFHDFPAGRT